MPLLLLSVCGDSCVNGNIAASFAPSTAHHVITPIMYSMILPLVFLDVSMSVFHWAIFGLYEIPKVHRRNYVVVDRHRLQYQSAFE